MKFDLFEIKDIPLKIISSFSTKINYEHIYGYSCQGQCYYNLACLKAKKVTWGQMYQ
jgi:hypothetical protein